MFIDLESGRDPLCGTRVERHQDILVMPFLTEEFCSELVHTAKHYEHRMLEHRQDSEQLSYHALHFTRISGMLFEDWVQCWIRDLMPVVQSEWPLTRIPGWQDPFILHYANTGSTHLDLHHDYSTVSLNVKLNDDYEGADLEFPRQSWSARSVPVGHVIMWPSTVTHPHRVTELKQGEKYSLTAWTWPAGCTDSPGIRNTFTDHR